MHGKKQKKKFFILADDEDEDARMGVCAQCRVGCDSALRWDLMIPSYGAVGVVDRVRPLGLSKARLSYVLSLMLGNITTPYKRRTVVSLIQSPRRAPISLELLYPKSSRDVNARLLSWHSLMHRVPPHRVVPEGGPPTRTGI